MIYEKMHFSRYEMYRRIETWANQFTGSFHGNNGKTVGGCSPLIELFPQCSWEITNFFVYGSENDLIFKPSKKINYTLGNKPVDAHSLPWFDGEVDILISDQMLEHVSRPWIVASEFLRVLKKGGVLICTTCFLQRSHDKGSYFNFHPSALKVLFSSSLRYPMFEGWGNPKANYLINYTNTRNFKVYQNQELSQMCRVNDKDSPFATWVCGIKR